MLWNPDFFFLSPLNIFPTFDFAFIYCKNSNPFVIKNFHEPCWEPLEVYSSQAALILPRLAQHCLSMDNPA